MNLALFDLDHTLLAIDSDQAWGVFTCEVLGWTHEADFMDRNAAFYADYKAGRLDLAAYVRFATDAVRLAGPQAAQAAHQRFMEEVIEPAILPQALALVERHRAAGDGVLIVTATNEFVTGPIAQRFGVEDLIAVQLARDGQGWITGEILGVPSAREGKVTRVQQWLESRGMDWTRVRTTFYSDSINDLALLERVNHPVATNPDAALRTQAHARGWPVLDLFTKR